MKTGWIILIAAGFSLAVGWTGCIVPLNGVHDSLRYLGMAETLLKGEWLGAYNELTLIRSPVYSVFLAANSLTGWPLHRVQHGIYLISIIVLTFGLRHAGVRDWRAECTGALCAIHPFAMIPAWYVATDALYTPLTLMAVAACLGISGNIDRPGKAFWAWTGVLSVFLPLAWHMRPEGVWLLPFFGAGILGVAWHIRQNWRNVRFRLMAVILLPVLAVQGTGHIIAHQNLKHYGVAVVHELDEPGFRQAFAGLTRLDPESRRPHVPVSDRAFEEAFRISPHFARLEPEWTNVRQNWIQFGCLSMRICDALAGGWTVWAVRDAAARVGVFVNGSHAAEFFRAVSHEIEMACQNGQSPCSRNVTGNLLAPPTTFGDIPNILLSICRWMWEALSLGDFPEKFQNHGIDVDQVILKRYGEITHDNPEHGKIVWGQSIHRMVHMTPFIQVGMGILASLMLIISTTNRMALIGHHGFARLKHPWILAWILVAILSRMALIGYIDAMSFQAQLRYILPVYPLLMLLFCLSWPAWKIRSTPVTISQKTDLP
ncbi:MAG: hypothetical protein AB7S77_19175 [Desulfatirhabdiaceae bacterium]